MTVRPPLFCLGIRIENRFLAVLYSHCNCEDIANNKKFVSSCFGGPEGDRTLDLTDANRALIPAELRAQMMIFCCVKGPA